VSHSKEREEKICLNCGAALTGRYCPVCGQENTEPKETVWGLFSHFFNDITHFDGKFFSTVKYLITKPGFLSQEYIKGRRASYLHPIRMYVFTSAFFFIIFFSVFNPENLMKESKTREETLTELMLARTELNEKMPGTKDSVLKAAIQRSVIHIDGHAAILEKEIAEKKQKDSVKLVQKKELTESAEKKIKANLKVAGEVADNLPQMDSLLARKKRNENTVNTNITLDYRSRIAYDSVQKELPADKRDGWFKRGMEHKVAMLYSKSGNNKKEALVLLMEKFMHTLPQALFISLPVFALLLQMLYARRKFYYADHGIFTIHLYCAVFIILLIYFGIDKLQVLSGWAWLTILKVLLVLGIFFYLYKAMRTFYGQRRGKTILKFTLLNLSFFIVVTLLGIFSFFLSLIQFS
jgi:Protein of unknown function (DUF3667)